MLCHILYQLRLLYCIKHLIAYPIFDLINESNESGVFPEALKLALITPVYKSISPMSVANYRPISILPPWLSKVCQNNLYTRMDRCMESQSILADCQFGFVTGHATTDSISKLIEFIYGAFNSGDYAVGLFVDLYVYSCQNLWDCRPYYYYNNNKNMDKLHIIGSKVPQWRRLAATYLVVDSV